MKQLLAIAIGVLMLFGCNTNHEKKSAINTEANVSVPEMGQVEIVAELPFNPGNVAVSSDGRVFASVHQFRNPELKVIEITGKSSFEPFPNKEMHTGENPDSTLNAVLGIYIDAKDRIWLLDNGSIAEPTRPKLLVYDIESREQLYRYDFPDTIGAPGTLLQDLVVDPRNDVAFIADVGGNYNPALVFVDIKKGESRRFEGHISLKPEKVDMVVEEKKIVDNEGKPIRIGVNPITISTSYDTIFYGAMNGTTWYKMPTIHFLNHSSDEQIAASITVAGKKTVSDGAASDAEGNHYFTDVNNNAITYYSVESGAFGTLVKDDRFIWPDNVRFGDDSWLYVSVNQLNRSPAFNEGKETAQLPYCIYRIWTGKRGHY